MTGMTAVEASLLPALQALGEVIALFTTTSRTGCLARRLGEGGGGVTAQGKLGSGDNPWGLFP